MVAIGWPELLSAACLSGGAALGVAADSDATVLMLASALLAAVALGTAWLTRRDRHRPTLSPGEAACTPRTGRPGAAPDSRVRRVCTAFLAWLDASAEQEDLWTSFDQFVRETLTAELESTRIRCYHVRPAGDGLEPLAQAGRSAPQNASLREGLLGHVATTGREFTPDGPNSGPLLERLAAENEEEWSWIWPVRQHGATLGLVAVGRGERAGTASAAACAALGPLLTLFWSHVAGLDRLRIVQRTDQASGVLTRNDFFAVADHALESSYRANEPLVIAVVALEGLRRLDDAGHWQARDELIERLGHVAAARLRSDDVVGRFADDRFVLLLRRLDSGLGRLIAEKLLAAGEECIATSGATSDQVRLRIGLAGSGFAQPPLAQLMAAAFDGVERARRQEVSIQTDLPSANTAEQRP